MKNSSRNLNKIKKNKNYKNILVEEKDSRIGAVYVVEERSYTLWRGGSHNRKGLWRVNSGHRWGILEKMDGLSIQVFKLLIVNGKFEVSNVWDFKHDKWGRQLQV